MSRGRGWDDLDSEDLPIIPLGMHSDDESDSKEVQQTQRIAREDMDAYFAEVIAENMSGPWTFDGCQRREEATDNTDEIIDAVELLRKEEAAVKAVPGAGYRADYKVWAADADITLEDFARPRNQEQEKQDQKKRKRPKKRRRLNEWAGIGVRIAVVIALIVATVALL